LDRKHGFSINGSRGSAASEKYCRNYCEATSIIVGITAAQYKRILCDAEIYFRSLYTLAILPVFSMAIASGACPCAPCFQAKNKFLKIDCNNFQCGTTTVQPNLRLPVSWTIFNDQ
jgi:hypothetical protein